MKFKVGDKVRVVKGYHPAKKGMTGNVAAFGPNGWPGIDFGPGFDGHHLHGAIKTDTGYYVPADDLELLPEEVREIKPGSKWRNVHGEVTVDDNDPDISFSIADAPFAMDEQFFRMTHEWVSDPVETPKVGSWVEDVDGPRVVVVKNEKSNPFCAIPQYLLHPDIVGNEYKPCEPPPLVKALDVLADTHPGDEFEWRHVQAVMTEWRAIKAKMGVE